MGVLRALFSKLIVITRDVAVVNFDDLGCAKLLQPSCTVVIQHPYEIGGAVGLLLEQIARKSTERFQEVRCSTQLIVRGST